MKPQGYNNSNESGTHLEYKYGIVTFLDILGWKGIWRREKDNPITKIENLQNFISSITNTGKEYRTTKSTIVSDSILIHSYIEDPGFKAEALNDRDFRVHDYIKTIECREQINQLLRVHYELGSSMIPISIFDHIPLRGATSIGAYCIYNETFVGSAIDEVANWYETANWAGIFMSPSLVYFLKENDFANIDKEKKWVKYPPPFKKEVGKFNTYCVNWLYKTANLSDDVEYKKESFEKLKASFWDQNLGIFPPEITSKIESTLEFAKK